MLKRISLISMLAASLVGCGSGGGAATRSPVDPSMAYGQVQGSATKYTGQFLPFFTPLGLQGVITTNSAVTSALGGADVFGVCYGLDNSAQGSALCNSNLASISSNPSFASLFHSGINIGNFVVAGATALGIHLVQPYTFSYTSAGAPYQFGGGATNPETVSAVVLVPELAPGVPLPANQIKGVVLYYHPTILSKGGVPSDLNGNLTPNNTAASTLVNAVTAFATDATLAAVYASQGYVVVAPDYVGQGVNYQVQHPYVIFPQTNAISGLTALKAARTALAAQNIMLPSPAKLYISSYSEGGAYALWASKLAQTTYASFLADSGFQLRRTIGVSGAYDLTGATLNYEFANANNSLDKTVNVWNVSPGLIPGTTPPFNNQTLLAGAKVVSALNIAASKTSLAGYVITALGYYNSSSASTTVLAPNYAPMSKCVNWNIASSSGSYVTKGDVTPQSTFTNCPLPMNVNATYNTSGLTQTQIVSQSFAAATAAAIGANAFLTGGMTFDDLVPALAKGYTNNSVGTFVEPGVLHDPTIIPFVAQGNIQSWVTNSPLDLLFLNYDSTVPNINSLEACGNLPASAAFPGFQPGYTGGVKQLSAPGMVTCVNLANNGLGPLPQLFTQTAPMPAGSGIGQAPELDGVSVPLMVDHGQAEAVLQVLALTRILANP